MVNRIELQGGSRKDIVGPSDIAQSAFLTNTMADTKIDKGQETSVYVPPSIRRLRELSIDDSNSNNQAKTLQRFGTGATKAPSNEKNESSGAQQQFQRETEEKLCPKEVELASQYVRENFPAFNELAELRLKV